MSTMMLGNPSLTIIAAWPSTKAVVVERRQLHRVFQQARAAGEARLGKALHARDSRRSPPGECDESRRRSRSAIT